MKIIYKNKNNGLYKMDVFTYDKVYNVIADYRERESRQAIRDNGFIVLDDSGHLNMLFEDQVIISDSNVDETYVFIRSE